jgi:hypothetical protein
MSNRPDVVIVLTLSEGTSPSDFRSLKLHALRVLNSLESYQRFAMVAFNHELIGFRTGQFQPTQAVPDAREWLDLLMPRGQAQFATLTSLLTRIDGTPAPLMVLVLAAGFLPIVSNPAQSRASQTHQLLISGINTDPIQLEQWRKSINATSLPPDPQILAEARAGVDRRQAIDPSDPFGPPLPVAGRPPGARPADVVMVIMNAGTVTEQSFVRVKTVVSDLLYSLPPEQRFALISLDGDITGFQMGEFVTQHERESALEWLLSLENRIPETAAQFSTLKTLLNRVVQLEGEILMFLFVAGRLDSNLLELPERTSWDGRVFLVGIDVDPAMIGGLRKAIGASILPPKGEQLLALAEQLQQG